MKKFDTRVYSISDFLEWRKTQLLDLSPDFQRRSVWSRVAKSFLMDTIIRGKPVPKLLITQKLQEQKNVRTVVDGQQRLRAILEFIAGDFTLLKAHNPQYAGIIFSDLPNEVQTEILKYELGVDLLYDVALPDLLDIFARINTYSVVLNQQEKFNAKYLGVFKTYAYELGHQYVSYFMEGGILSKSSVTRMGEAHLSSELLVALCAGPQSAKNVEKYYKQYEASEEAPPELANAKELFHNTMSYIGQMYEAEDIRNSNWSSSPWFYTLFVCVAHVLHPLNGLNDASRPALSNENIGKWRVQLDEISAQYEIYTQDGASNVPEDFKTFIQNSKQHTTETDTRLARAKFVLSKLNSLLG